MCYLQHLWTTTETHYRSTTCLAVLTGTFLKWGRPPNSLSCFHKHCPFPFKGHTVQSLITTGIKSQMLWKAQINQLALPPVSKSQLMFSSPEFVFTSSCNHEKGGRNYNQLLSYNDEHFKSTLTTNLHTTAKSKKSSPSQTYHFLLHEAISPSLSLPCCFPQYLQQGWNQSNEHCILSCFGLLQLATFLQQPRLWLSSDALPRPGWASKKTHILTSAALLTEIKSTVGQFLLLWNASNSYNCWQKWCEINFQAYTAHCTESCPSPHPNLYNIMLPPEKLRWKMDMDS